MKMTTATAVSAVRQESEIVAYIFILSGNEVKDAAYADQVRALAERCGGEFYLENDWGKHLYRFEIGGEFYAKADAAKFKAGMQKIIRAK
jgi:hypothetical protein